MRVSRCHGCRRPATRRWRTGGPPVIASFAPLASLIVVPQHRAVAVLEHARRHAPAESSTILPSERAAVALGIRADEMSGRTTSAVTRPDVPGVHALGTPMIGITRGSTIDALKRTSDQPDRTGTFPSGRWSSPQSGAAGPPSRRPPRTPASHEGAGRIDRSARTGCLRREIGSAPHRES